MAASLASGKGDAERLQAAGRGGRAGQTVDRVPGQAGVPHQLRGLLDPSIVARLVEQVIVERRTPKIINPD